MSARSRLRLRDCALLLGALMGTGVSAQQPGLTEYQVKAGFIFNFARLVEWPPRTPPPATLQLCLLGNDPFGGATKDQIAGKAIDGRKLEIRALASAADAAGCDLVFVSATPAGNLNRLLSAIKDQPVLTIGDSEGMAAQGTIISFYRYRDEVRFEINPDAASRAGLRISSRLLALARVLHDPGAP